MWNTGNNRAGSMMDQGDDNIQGYLRPRTHLLQQAIELAEKGDFSLSESLLEATSTPFDARWDTHAFSKPPSSSTHTSLSCSS